MISWNRKNKKKYLLKKMKKDKFELSLFGKIDGFAELFHKRKNIETNSCQSHFNGSMDPHHRRNVDKDM